MTEKNENDPWVIYDGYEGVGNSKHIVFVSGDEEYRSEEALPMLAKIMAVHHGFRCTVLFAIDPETGVIDPSAQTNIPGLHHLRNADMMVLMTRFRELPDEDMKHIVDHTNAGKPVLGLRTATHAFKYSRNKDSPYAEYSCDSKSFEGGYGRQVLGETWVNHHGHHGRESTRGVINEANGSHPVLKGVENMWCPSDVYQVTELTGEPTVLVDGQVLTGMDPTDVPNPDKTTMPVAWVKNYTGETGNTSRVFCSTMGSAVDLANEGIRRLIVNGCFWCMGMEDQIPEKNQVGFVDPFDPVFFGFGQHTKGVRPCDLSIGR